PPRHGLPPDQKMAKSQSSEGPSGNAVREPIARSLDPQKWTICTRESACLTRLPSAQSRRSARSRNAAAFHDRSPTVTPAVYQATGPAVTLGRGAASLHGGEHLPGTGRAAVILTPSGGTAPNQPSGSGT